MPVVAPTWSAPLDPERYLRKMPSGATAKGMFFGLVQRELDRAGKRDAVPEAAPSYTSFRDYPYERLLQLEVAACRELYPGHSLREGLRRLGRSVFGMFTGQMIGKVLFGVVGDDVHQVLKLSAKGYAVAASVGSAEPVNVREGSGVLRLMNVPNFPSTYHVGVVEGTLAHLGFKHRVEIEEHSLFDVDIHATWW